MDKTCECLKRPLLTKLLIALNCLHHITSTAEDNWHLNTIHVLLQYE